MSFKEQLSYVGFYKLCDVKVRVNIFCDGKVQSRTLRYPDGTMKTLGVYLPGEFEFHSDGPESVVMTAGEVEVNFPTVRVAKNQDRRTL